MVGLLISPVSTRTHFNYNQFNDKNTSKNVVLDQITNTGWMQLPTDYIQSLQKGCTLLTIFCSNTFSSCSQNPDARVIMSNNHNMAIIESELNLHHNILKTVVYT